MRADRDLDAAVSGERALDDLARDLVGPAAEGMGARSAVRDLARGVVSRGAQPLTWEPLHPSASYAATTASAAGIDEVVGGHRDAGRRRETGAWLEAERAEAHRLEVERLEQARIDAERREAERLEAERARAEELAAERARPNRPRGSRRSDGPQPRRESALSASVVGRNASRRTGWRSSAGRPKRVRRSGLEAERRAAGRRRPTRTKPSAGTSTELERLQAELATSSPLLRRQRPKARTPKSLP